MTELARNVEAVTPGATPLSGGPAMGLLVTSDGNLSFTAKGGGNSGTFAVTAGTIIPIIVTHVLGATTAGVLALR
jgi:hypothetical protein